MTKRDDKIRVLLAITEFCPVGELWRAALQRLGESQTDLVALFVAEDHWHRAARLPFTREISRVSGANVDFTWQRAQAVHEDAISRARTRMKQLASDANLALAFEVLGESDQERVRELFAGARNLLIAPSLIEQRPLYAELIKLDCRVELVEVAEAIAPEPQSAGRDK